MSLQTISPRELNEVRSKNPSTLIVDVRTPAEFEAVRAEGAINHPLDRLDTSAISGLRNENDDVPIYMICKMGGRSGKACEKMLAAGHTKIVNVQGGTDRWVSEGLPSITGERTVMAIDRQVRIAAGLLTLLGALLGYFLDVNWLWLSAFVGAGLIFSGATDSCAMGSVLAKMPWNQVRKKKAG